MASILICGKTRGLLTGALPAGVSSEEVDSLAAIREKLEDRGTVVLVDEGLLAEEHRAIEAWLKTGGSDQALVFAVVDAGQVEEVARRFPFVDDVLTCPVTSARLGLRLQRAHDVIRDRRVTRQLEASLLRKDNELQELNKIGAALSAERDIDQLLDLILLKCREITAADAGSLYLVARGKDDTSDDDDRLIFKLAQNHSVRVEFKEFTMRLDDTTLAGYAAKHKEALKVEDAYHLRAGSPYQYGKSFDEKSGYRTKSVLCVPMSDHQGNVIGVVQLINKKREATRVLKPAAMVDEHVIEFSSVDRGLVESLASQAAVAYNTTLLIHKIKNLFDSFIRASVTTIEKRDPVTSGHSEGVAILTVDLAEKVDASTTPRFRNESFTRDQIQEIRYASLLHDFGKVGVKEKYLRKAKKLYGSHHQLLEQRFDSIQRALEVEHLEAKIRQIEAGAPRALLEEMDQAFHTRREEIRQFLRMIRQANEPTILDEEGVRATLQDLAKRTYRDTDGNHRPFLEPDEVQALSIKRGSLTDEERQRINEHVQNTYDFLKELPWTSELRRVPEIAWKHHAKLDGTGYPQPWKGDDIPIEARMMTIADIFDALTAWDRPYKKAVPVDKALDILKTEEAGRGKIDSDLVDLFIEARIYEGRAYKELHEQRIRAAASR
jgi:HD-GYP domain-containing protein (c-di-GMP phosphodiesterase class II)